MTDQSTRVQVSISDEEAKKINDLDTKKQSMLSKLYLAQSAHLRCQEDYTEIVTMLVDTPKDQQDSELVSKKNTMLSKLCSAQTAHLRAREEYNTASNEVAAAREEMLSNVIQRMHKQLNDTSSSSKVSDNIEVPKMGSEKVTDMESLD
jgi:hypothetical protein